MKNPLMRRITKALMMTFVLTAAPSLKATSSHDDAIRTVSQNNPTKNDTDTRPKALTARDLGLQYVTHQTGSFQDYEAITSSPTLQTNVFISRPNTEGELALQGPGFYTTKDLSDFGYFGSGQWLVWFRVDPRARKGIDFELPADDLSHHVVLFKNKSALQLIGDISEYDADLKVLELFQAWASQEPKQAPLSLEINSPKPSSLQNLFDSWDVEQVSPVIQLHMRRHLVTGLKNHPEKRQAIARLADALLHKHLQDAQPHEMLVEKNPTFWFWYFDLDFDEFKFDFLTHFQHLAKGQNLWKNKTLYSDNGELKKLPHAMYKKMCQYFQQTENKQALLALAHNLLWQPIWKPQYQSFKELVFDLGDFWFWYLQLPYDDLGVDFLAQPRFKNLKKTKNLPHNNYNRNKLVDLKQDLKNIKTFVYFQIWFQFIHINSPAELQTLLEKNAKRISGLGLYVFDIDVDEPKGAEEGTLLWFISGSRNPELLQLLLDAGADPNLYLQDYYKRTPLMEASGTSDDYDYLDDLTMQHNHMRTTDKNVKEDAWIANSWHKRAQSIQKLLEAGADPNLQDKYGQTALHYITQNIRPYNYIYLHQHVQLLLKNSKIDVNIPNQYEQTVLMLAARSGHIELVKAFIDAGAKLDLQDDSGQTALMHAVQNESSTEQGHENKTTQIVQLLLDSGADPTIEDEEGQTALNLAQDEAQTTKASQTKVSTNLTKCEELLSLP